MRWRQSSERNKERQAKRYAEDPVFRQTAKAARRVRYDTQRAAAAQKSTVAVNSKVALVECHPSFLPTPAEFKLLLEDVPGVGVKALESQLTLEVKNHS